MWRVEQRGSRGRKRPYGGTSAANRNKRSSAIILFLLSLFHGIFRSSAWFFPLIRRNKIFYVRWKFKGTKGNGLAPARSAAFTWSAMGRKSIPSRRRWIFAEPPKET